MDTLELAALMDQPREGVELVGVITDEPFVRSARGGINRTWNFPVRVEMIHRLPSWQTAHGTVQVRLRDSPGNRSPQYGERWRLSGVLVDNARFPDARPVLEWIKNRYSFTADPAAGICLAEDQGARLGAAQGVAALTPGAVQDQIDRALSRALGQGRGAQHPRSRQGRAEAEQQRAAADQGAVIRAMNSAGPK